MIRLNLLPDIKREYLKSRRTQAKVISMAVLLCVVAVGAVVVLALWVYVAQWAHMNILTDSINKKVTTLSQIKDVDKYVTMQNQLANLSSLHEEKNDYSRLLKFLPILNPKAPNNVRLHSVETSDDTQSIVFKGESDDYSGLATFRDIMQNADFEYRTGEGEAATTQKDKLFSSIIVDEQNMAKTPAGTHVVIFKITVEYNKAAFLHSSRDVVLSIPKLETTPSKQDSPDLFSATKLTDGQGE